MSNSTENQKPPKTYKRETAWTLLALWTAMMIWGVFDPQANLMAQFITLPVFTFAGGAFAIDAAFKQGGYKR